MYVCSCTCVPARVFLYVCSCTCVHACVFLSPREALYKLWHQSYAINVYSIFMVLIRGKLLIAKGRTREIGKRSDSSATRIMVLRWYVMIPHLAIMLFLCSYCFAECRTTWNNTPKLFRFFSL
jgi:hypothetical protein